MEKYHSKQFIWGSCNSLLHIKCFLSQQCILLPISLLCYVKTLVGTSLAIQWLGLHALNAGGAGSIPDEGTKILHATRSSQKKHAC